jgi:hypothetical protein
MQSVVLLEGCVSSSGLWTLLLHPVNDCLVIEDKFLTEIYSSSLLYLLAEFKDDMSTFGFFVL